jgi:hypothetical protein
MEQDAGSVGLLKIIDRGFGVGVGCRRNGIGARAWNTRREAFDLTDGHATASYFLREFETRFGVSDSEKRAGVAGRDSALLDELLDRSFQFQEADGIGDGGAIFSGALGDLFLCEVEFVSETLKGVCLLDGIEILALKILDEGHLHRHTLRYVADDDRHTWKFGALRSAPAAFAGN